MSSRILHVDLDAFFVEVCRQRFPELRDVELLVVGGRRESRGVVQSASYAARQFGVRSGMPIAQAARLCPDATFFRGSFADYRDASRAVRSLLGRYSPTVAMASLDEGYLDFTGTERLYPVSLLPIAERAARGGKAVDRTRQQHRHRLQPDDRQARIGFREAARHLRSAGRMGGRVRGGTLPARPPRHWPAHRRAARRAGTHGGDAGAADARGCAGTPRRSIRPGTQVACPWPRVGGASRGAPGPIDQSRDHPAPGLRRSPTTWTPCW